MAIGTPFAANPSDSPSNRRAAVTFSPAGAPALPCPASASFSAPSPRGPACGWRPRPPPAGRRRSIPSRRVAARAGSFRRRPQPDSNEDSSAGRPSHLPPAHGEGPVAGGRSLPIEILPDPRSAKTPGPLAAGGVSRADAREEPPAAGAKRSREVRRAIEAASGRVARRCARRAQTSRERGATAYSMTRKPIIPACCCGSPPQSLLVQANG